MGLGQDQFASGWRCVSGRWAIARPGCVQVCGLWELALWSSSPFPPERGLGLLAPTWPCQERLNYLELSLSSSLSPVTRCHFAL